MNVRHVGGAALLAVCLALTGCSSGGNSGAAAPGSEPIELGLQADITDPVTGVGQPQEAQAAQAAVDAINKAGGINGRPLHLTACDTKTDPNKVASCARGFAGDDKVVAVVASSSGTAAPEPIYEKAGMPYWGLFPLSQADFTSPVAFPLIGGGVVAVQAIPTMAQKYITPKPATVGIAYFAAPAFAAMPTILSDALKPAGMTLTNTVKIAPGAADLTAPVASTSSKVDAVVSGTPPPISQQIIVAARKAALTQPIILSSGLDSNQLASLGPAAEGVYEVDSFPPVSADFPGGKQFLDETASLGSTFVVDEVSINAWVGVHMLADQLKTMTTIDRAGVLAKLKSVTNADMYGFGTPLSTTAEFTGLGGAYPRLFGRDFYMIQIKNGKPTLLQSDPFRIS